MLYVNVFDEVRVLYNSLSGNAFLIKTFFLTFLQMWIARPRSKLGGESEDGITQLPRRQRRNY